MPNTNTLTELFEDIADAIRAKDGTSAQITASDFPTRILAIPSGGGGGEYEFNIKYNMNYFDYNGNWDDVIEDTSNTFVTFRITGFTEAFKGTKLKSIPITINFDSSGSLSVPNISVGSAFEGTSLETIDLGNSLMYWIAGSTGTNIFARSVNLRTIYAPNVKTYGGQSMFNSCYSLRELPFSISSGYTKSATSHPYKNMFQECYALNKIENLGVHTGSLTTNVFTSTFYGCSHLSKLTFDMGGQSYPINSSMKNQTIDLTTVGRGSRTFFLDYNSGITADKEVTDATSYAALKNDPDWFTEDNAYSRYNHDSAVETINTLPNTGTSTGNIIKFNGAMGSATDGGAINTLTAAEIAVATDRGWTVTLV